MPRYTRSQKKACGVFFLPTMFTALTSTHATRLFLISFIQLLPKILLLYKYYISLTIILLHVI